MCMIIGCNLQERRRIWWRRQLECPFPHVLDLQCAAGSLAGGESSLLADPDDASRQISRGSGGAAGESAGTPGWIAACHLGACRVGGRGIGGQRVGGRVAAALPAASSGGFD